MIAFSCDGCGKAFRVADTLEGRKSRCKDCGTAMRIPPPALTVEPLRPKTRRPVSIEPWLSLGIGAVLTCVALYVPFIAIVAWCLATVIHELGHTVTSWLFGIPAIPAFDLKHGGGITRGLGRTAAVRRCGLLHLRLRDISVETELESGDHVAGPHLPLQFGDGDRAAQHLDFGDGPRRRAAVRWHIVYRALSGSQVLRREERPLYAFLGLFMLFINTRLAWGLIH